MLKVLTLQRFVGLYLVDGIPDHRTVWFCGESLGTAGGHLIKTSETFTTR